MNLRPALVTHLLGLAILRCASALVPWSQRVEWWKEWQSELWHVRQACTPDRGISWVAEREVAAFCLGAFQDALCLRSNSEPHSEPRRISHAVPMGSAMQCILLLISLAAVSYGVALTLPALPRVLPGTALAAPCSHCDMRERNPER
jgi:hypothetical protein